MGRIIPYIMENNKYLKPPSSSAFPKKNNSMGLHGEFWWIFSAMFDDRRVTGYIPLTK